MSRTYHADLDAPSVRSDPARLAVALAGAALFEVRYAASHRRAETVTTVTLGGAPI
jgi:hypothetical protein